MKTLYFDCFSGISGDMTIGALLDLGLDLEYLKAELRKLPVEGYELQASRVVRANISAMKFDVVVGGARMKDTTHHHHEHAHDITISITTITKRHEILGMIRQSALNANTKRIADAIFTKLAISEGKVHHISPEDVEFHEVGAVDSIVDTVGAAIGFDALGSGTFSLLADQCRQRVHSLPAWNLSGACSSNCRPSSECDDLFQACDDGTRHAYGRSDSGRRC